MEDIPTILKANAKALESIYKEHMEINARINDLLIKSAIISEKLKLVSLKIAALKKL